MAGFGTMGDGRVINLFKDAKKDTFDAGKLAESFRRRPSATWSIPEAYMALLLAAATVDNHFDEDERQIMLWISRRSRALRHLSPEALAAANDSVIKRLQGGGPAAIAEACDSLPSDLVPHAFAHCCQVALADGELGSAETQFLKDLVTQLRLDQQEASKILEVMLLSAS